MWGRVLPASLGVFGGWSCDNSGFVIAAHHLQLWSERTKLVSALLVSWGSSWAGGWEAVPGQHFGRAGVWGSAGGLRSV